MPPTSSHVNDVQIISINPGPHAQVIDKIVTHTSTHQTQGGHTVTHHSTNHPEMGMIDGKYVPQSKAAHGSSTVIKGSGITIVNNLQVGEQVIGQVENVPSKSSQHHHDTFEFDHGLKGFKAPAHGKSAGHGR